MADDRLIPLPDVLRLTGIRKDHLYKLMRRGEFPIQAKVGRASRWSLAEVSAWTQARLSERRAA